MAFREKWDHVPKFLQIAVYTLLGVVGAAAVGLLLGYGMELLWNWLMPMLFRLPKINFWEAVGIFILAKILFGSVSSSSGSGSKPHKKHKNYTVNLHGKKAEREEPEGMDCYDEWWESEGKRAFEEFAGKKRTDKS